MTRQVGVVLSVEEIDRVLVMLNQAMQVKEYMGAQPSGKEEHLFSKFEEAKKSARKQGILDGL